MATIELKAKDVPGLGGIILKKTFLTLLMAFITCQGANAMSGKALPILGIPSASIDTKHSA